MKMKLLTNALFLFAPIEDQLMKRIKAFRNEPACYEFCCNNLALIPSSNQTSDVFLLQIFRCASSEV